METRLPSKFVQTACAATILSLLSGAAGAQAPQSWSLTGNAGTDPVTNFLGTIDNKDLVVKTHNTDALRVDEKGKVIIGPFSSVLPYAKFNVVGADATPNVETAEVMRLMRHGVSGVKNENSAGFFVGSFEQGVNGRSQLDIRVAGLPANSNTFGSVPDVTVMSLLGNGNVGIGTTSPDSTLTVNGTSTIGKAQSSAGTTFAAVYDEGSGWLGFQKRGTSQTGNLGLGLNASEIVSTSGNLGIFTYTSGGYLALGTSNRERLRVDANGNVGIGTSTPQTQLHVNGTATVKVLQITGGSDLAEPFAMGQEATIQAGMVVAIPCIPASSGWLTAPTIVPWPASSVARTA